tara:strand:+ start:2719 stop:3564 length:846 start_codon:yes stop_codon:yes gene_type:complete
MVLIDFTQTIIASLMVNLKRNEGEISEDFLRYLILNSLRNYQKRYGPTYGKIVLCTDAGNPWRRDFFPLYKAGRKKARDNDDNDWKLIFDTLQIVKDEIRENFPYYYMYVPNCEADDIIAVLTQRFHKEEDILIVSGDKDFQQLLKYDNVQQYSPNRNDFITPEGGAEHFLKEHILKGDKGDGIPNILSNDDCLDLGIRQTPLRKPILEKYLRISIENDDKYFRNYIRNRTLIDFDLIPNEIIDSINTEFDNTNPAQGKVYDFLREKRITQLLDNIGDFSL